MQDDNPVDQSKHSAPSGKHYLQEEFYQLFNNQKCVDEFVEFASKDGAWYWDLENPDHEWMNAGMWETLGYDPAQMPHLAAAWQDIINQDDLQVALDNFYKHLEDPKHLYDQIVRYRHKNGSTVHIHCRGYAIRNDEGKPIRLLGVHTDVTKREEALSLVQSHLETVLDTTSNAIVSLNHKKEIVTLNPAARHILGILDEAPPLRWPSNIMFLDRDDLSPLEASKDPINRAMVGQVIRDEVHAMNRSVRQSPRYVRITTTPVEDKTSDLSMVLIIDDVTEVENSKQTIDRQSRLDALGQLTGGIAHDFNNLLGTVLYAVDIMRRDGLSERGEKSANTAIKNIERGSDLTSRLLAFAKQQPERATTNKLVDVWAGLHSLIDTAVEETIDVKLNDVDDDLFVYCDQGQLDNAILNLVLNSRDSILRGKIGDSIKIRARAINELTDATIGSSVEGGAYLGQGRHNAEKSDIERADGRAQRYVEISVADNGPGMTDLVKKRAVDPFFTTKDTVSGAGLGLSMVYGFVQQSNGELRIYSEEGLGTTVRIFLPRGSSNSKGKEVPQERVSLVMGNGETILLAEDEPGLLEQMNEVLLEMNYKTICARSGREALDILARGEQIELLITDIVMPGGIGGFELAKQARKLAKDIPVIYMSGYTGFSDEEMGEVIAPMLAKPTPAYELSVAISDLLKNK